MKIDLIAKLIDAVILNAKDKPEVLLETACGSDLMSDVMAYGDEKDMLLTGLVNPQVIRTAEMMDIKAVVFVRGKKPTDMMMELANEKNIVLMSTKLPMFDACGRLFDAGICGESV